MTTYVLEQLIRLRRLELPGAFYQRAAPVLAEAPDIKAEEHPRGLRLLAENESALGYAVDCLHRHFPDEFVVLAPEVLLQEEPVLAEPVMAVMTELPLLHERRARQSLLRRGAEIISVDLGPATHTVHAQLPMARLLGYPDEVAGYCPGAWIQVMFSHYEPLTPPPGPSAA